MSNQDNYEKFLLKLSDNIKKLRLKCGYTQEDMVDFGFNYRHYQRLESGTHSPSLSTLFKLAQIFKIPISKIFKP
jgi:DNA-binding XRE family transcriptional regulator